MKFESITRAFRKAKILVIGDLMVDKYLYGRSTRMSPEAEVPVLDFEKEDQKIGGAGNVALNLLALGCQSYLVSLIGNDPEGDWLESRIEGMAGLKSLLFRVSGRPTTLKTRVISQNGHMMRVDREFTETISRELEDDIFRKTIQFIESEQIKGLVFQDYNKGMLSPGLISRLIDWSSQNEVLTFVDPKLDNFWAYRGIYCFKPNLKEVRQGLGDDSIKDLTSLREASYKIEERLDNQLTLITLGERGVFVSARDREGQIVPAPERDVVDVCGAGDAVIAMGAACILSDLDLATTARLINMAGGQVCEKVGVAAVDLEQLKNEYGLL